MYARKTREEEQGNGNIVATLVTSTSSLTTSSTSQTTEKRFAYSLLEKLLEYVERASSTMQNYKESSKFSLHESYRLSTKDVKFFGKVRRNSSMLIRMHPLLSRSSYHWLNDIFKRIENTLSLHRRWKRVQDTQRSKRKRWVAGNWRKTLSV